MRWDATGMRSRRRGCMTNTQATGLVAAENLCVQLHEHAGDGDGRDTIWPLDPHTGWSYCVTVPSWILLPKSRGSDPVALKKAFPEKTLPPVPPKRILRRKGSTLLEKRRCSLEDWMEKLLSDIDVSRSAPVGTFLELEAAARSFFDDANSSASDIVPSALLQTNSDVSLLAGSLSNASDNGNGSPEISEVGTPRNAKDSSVDFGRETSTSEQNLTDLMEATVKYGIFNRKSILENLEKFSWRKMYAGREKNIVSGDEHAENKSRATAFFGDGNEPLHGLEYQRLDGHVRRLSTESIGSDLSSVKASEISNLGVGNLFGDDSLVLPEVKDLEVDLEITRNNCKENMQQAVLIERERFTRMQWDVEELRKQCLEMKLKLISEQDERALTESAKVSMIQENKMLLQQLNVAREELENLHKHHEELELKSKADVKLLVKEVKSLRSSQSDLKQELSGLMKEKIEVERGLRNEKQRMQVVTAANEDKLILDTSSPSDAIDLLTTSDNRIGLLLAEAQLLAEDVENSVARLDETFNTKGGDRVDDELRKLLIEAFVDNARLRMQVNSVIRCALNAHVKSDKDEEEEEEEEGNPLRKTVLSKFLERNVMRGTHPY
ncbi:hypothetical protein GH714_034220 [Hevea brasiliensis]|uniref:PX domain-containing protein n=1 Tax=Hevea brasiliensis TaxID=3981 RepID=A0A6A6NE95_HEVBR|nr:hypothetical protein GH714_034220 [Hevea brasiliensis]